MKLCDLTQFYSPVSGGVKRYVSEKVRFIRENTTDEHILIIPGERDEMIAGDRSRTYTIQSPLISRTSRYRVLLRLEAIERILETERPDLIECGDPYQVAWKAVHSGAALGIPVVGFYHSHFPEAYIRTVRKFCGHTVTEFFHDLSRRYIRSLYRRFARTIVPSPALGDLLATWGVPNIAHTDLGVDTAVFHPQPAPREDLRAQLAIPRDRTLLLYVGRLAQEKTRKRSSPPSASSRASSPIASTSSSSATASSARISAISNHNSPITHHRSPTCPTAPTPPSSPRTTAPRTFSSTPACRKPSAS